MKIDGKISHVWIVTPPSKNVSHTDCFLDVAGSFSKSLQELGHPAILTRETPETDDIALVFAPHLMLDPANRSPQIVPRRMILFNAEQLCDRWAESSLQNRVYLTYLQANLHPLWDYSRNNIDYLKSKGIEADLCEIGYHPSMAKPLHGKNKDIDVLFYGSLNARRKRIVADLSDRCVVKSVFGIYGEELDALVVRSKLVLNMHYYDTAVFEIFRCAPLLANAVPIVSEIGLDEDLEWPYRNCIQFAPYNRLVPECLNLVRDMEKRTTVGVAGSVAFRQSSQVQILDALLNRQEAAA